MYLEKNEHLIPSICRVWVTLVTDIANMVNGTDRFHKEITLKNTGLWREIYLSPSSAEYVEKQKPDEPGLTYEQALKFYFPGEDDTNTLLFNLIQYRPVVVLLMYSNNTFRIFGCIENGARLIRVSQFGPKISGSEVQITCLATEPSWWDSSETYPPA